ncbi:hypothetical protein FRC10_002429 [Ceratobasidium sp. 414]|nr:hypothetical protein FRC10_002429 [Ceratobasidium sp. 414]
MIPVPLPPTHENLQGSPLALAAYARLLPLESRDPIRVRLPGWMMIHAPSVAGQTYVATCIANSETDEEVIEWGNWFILYFAKYFKANLHKPPPTPPEHPSRPDLDVIREQILATLHETPQSHSDAKKYALIRDDYRCMLSGLVDTMSYLGSRRLQSTAGISVTPTQCSHILPQYLNQGLSDPLRRFGDIQAVNLSGAAMHNLSNILTLRSEYHSSFDSLFIWLDPIDGADHQYTVGRAFPALHPEIPAMVTFTTADPRLALPDPRYLALHAACAKVINMSGAGELINKYLDDAAETKVLSGDGSSGELLAHLLSAEVLMVR